MRSLRALGIVLVASAAALLPACGSSGSPADAPSSSTAGGSGTTGSTLSRIPSGAATVDAADTALGTVLVDGTGFTLYVFSGDGAAGGVSTCVDACATVWPPVTGDAIAVASRLGAPPGTFKLVARPDGPMQLTANGHPLYRYSGDTAPGETSGQGVGGQWYVAGIDGSAITG